MCVCVCVCVCVRVCVCVCVNRYFFHTQVYRLSQTVTLCRRHKEEILHCWYLLSIDAAKELKSLFFSIHMFIVCLSPYEDL